jgi:uncharacterized protein
MDTDWLIVLLTAVVVLFATTIHGIAGFGTGQITMGILPLFRDAGPASVIVSVVVFLTNVRVFWSAREAFTWRDYLIPVGGLAVGLPIGMYVFGALDEGGLRTAIGIAMVVATVLIILTQELNVVSDFVGESGWQPGIITGLIAGFLSGIFGGAVAIPGPPMLVYGAFMLESDQWDGAHMRATFTAFFATNLLYRLVVMMFTGGITGPLMLEALIMVPALILGTWLGIKLFEHMPKKLFRWMVLVLLLVLGTLLILG